MKLSWAFYDSTGALLHGILGSWKFYDATGVVVVPPIDHGTLVGLADDDHPQYLKEKLSGGTASEIPAHDHPEIAGMMTLFEPGEDGIDGLPGMAGQAGIQGIQGPAGADGPAGLPGLPGIDAEEPELPYIIPGPAGTISKRTVGMTFDGGGSSPTAGSIGFVVCQHAGLIDQWAIVADVSGSAVVDVWKLAGAIPTDADRIAGTEKPTLSSQQLNSDTALTTWTTGVAAGDVFGFELESVATCTRVTCEVRIIEA